jgi:hypothetical protein
LIKARDLCCKNPDTERTTSEKASWTHKNVSRTFSNFDPLYVQEDRSFSKVPISPEAGSSLSDQAGSVISFLIIRYSQTHFARVPQLLH